MAAQLQMTGSACKKRRFGINENLCIFCQKSFNIKYPSVSPDTNKLTNLLEACRKREDDAGKLIIAEIENIKNGNIKLKYHRNCRASYASQMHIRQNILADLNMNNPKLNSSNIDSFSFTRSQSGQTTFDWKKYCFICDQPCHHKRRLEWAMVESSIGTDGSSMYVKLLNAAEEREDNAMLLKLRGVPNGDLVAVEARYHRKKACHISYMNPRNILAAQPDKEIIKKQAHINALLKLKQIFYLKIVEEKEVFLLTTLAEKYRKLLTKENIPYALSYKYKAKHLKKQIIRDWEDVSFIAQSGQSDLVVSSSISVGQALAKALDLAQTVKEQKEDLDLSVSFDEVTTDEESTVHQAIGILRRRMSGVRKLQDEYYSSSEMILKAQKKFVDPLLYKVIGWLTNSYLYEEAQDIGETQLNEKCLNIACDITTCATSIFSPKHLGLANYLHHLYGSRQLIDDMYLMGYSISYTEFRQFQTSAAKYIQSLQPPLRFGTYIPPEIKGKSEGGRQPVTVADNFDHNEHTVDGKQTTHAMTSILVAPSVVDQPAESPRIERGKMRSLETNANEGGNLSDVIRYTKPPVRPEPKFETPVTVDDIKPSNSPSVLIAKLVEKLYTASRSGVFHKREAENKMPPWGDFHVTESHKERQLANSTIAYNPIIMAPPSNMSTIYTTLKRSKESINELGFKYSPVFFDMGLLTKALEITWSCPTELEGVIPCHGGMHFLMSVFSGVGHLYGDAGLLNLLHESGVYAPGTVQNMLNGRDFDRALRALRLVDEALNIRLNRQFMKWCERNGKSLPDYGNLVNCLDDRTDKQANEVVETLLPTFRDEVNPLIEEFRNYGREKSPTFKFWDDFLERVMLPLKIFVAATRNGNWDAYQAVQSELLPLLFVTNRHIYSRYMPAILLMMKQLPPEVESAFKDGLFVAKLNTGTYNGVWMDYTLEVTENKALKGRGGIIGLTLRGPALERWFVSRPVTAKYANAFQTRLNSHKQNENQHHLSTKSEKSRWNNDVKKIVEMFDRSYIDPFDLQNSPETLTNFALGLEATKEIEDSMINALAKGETMVEKFVEERFVISKDGRPPPKSFYAPMTRSTIKTMSSLRKKIPVKGKNVGIDGELMYLRLLAINAKKKVPLERVMSFENSSVPLSIFKEDGSMMSADKKSDFMRKLESLVPDRKITQIEVFEAIIYDGHAVIQSLPVPSTVQSTTFRDMANEFASYILRHSRSCQEIHVVFDKYLENSTKSGTREKRGETGATYHVNLQGQIPKNWKQFLQSGVNKAKIATCYTEYLCDVVTRTRLQNNQSMFISGSLGEKAIKITAMDAVAEPSLKSNIEEADGRIILHAVAASNKCEHIVISSPDTDVFVLLLHHRQSIKAREIFFLTGKEGKHKTFTRYIPVHAVYDKLHPNERLILLSVYCLSGCDTVSTFRGHGKTTAFKILRTKGSQLKSLEKLGTGVLTDDVKSACVMFVGAMYGKDNCTSINLLRCQIAAGKFVLAKKLPPTEDSLNLHILRAAFQLQIWRNSTTGLHDLPSPLVFGYTMEAGRIRPLMMNQTAAPQELLNDLVCQCPPNACHVNCVCLENEQPCTSACGCEETLTGDDIPTCNNYYSFQACQDNNEFST